ncbi:MULTISPECIES: alpha-keto acid decarboxylase family protein [Clostridium]|uniref:alpha-keto acid decarboxylase family protein n=1 Tax=Clostridium TaxID=1485 RepID=UPI0023BA02BC|nr:MULTISPECIES: alpha-keto acid decarboxylase family protein [Clostridium]
MTILKSEYTIGRYLLDRLSELGIRHIFGVPGDYNLSFLDYIMEYKGIDWVGNCNELNAGYAADGYARINGIGAILTTFGVGELSAINAIAGAYAEQVPVVKITGIPTAKVRDNGLYVHHTLGDGRFDHFFEMFREVTVAEALLSEENAAQEIDRVLISCWRQKRPVLINLPIDVYDKPINKPLKPLLDYTISSNKEAACEFVTEIVPIINRAKKPVILADYGVYRYQVQHVLKNLAEKTGFPVATLSMGKGVFNEAHPQFIGVYNGDVSSPYLRQRVDEADCIISVGVKLTDSTTGGFSHGFSKRNVIHIDPFSIKAKGKKYAPITMKDALTELTSKIEHRNFEDLDIKPYKSDNQKYFAKEKPITQKRFFERIAHFIKEKDVLLAEQGTCFFGASTIQLPKDATFIGQPLWGSIGYTLPALLGSQLADQKRRNILLIGDGAFQMTAQEISTMLRLQIKPIIFLINNDGYTIERAIHGREQVYNNIQMWRYHNVPKVLGPKECSLTFKVQSETELEKALLVADKDCEHLIFIEVVMDRYDKPEPLERLSKRFANQNN